MKKKIICGILSAVLIMSSFSAFAEDAPSESTEIVYSFRDIPWYTSKAETEEILFADGGSTAGSMSRHDYAFRLSRSDFGGSWTSTDVVEGGGYYEWYKGLPVAGYTPSDVYACYVYKLNPDGTILRSDDEAEFYFGWYCFDDGDFTDLRAIYDDLYAKLISLYGDSPEEIGNYNTTVSWFDSQNDQIRLLINTKETYVTVGYIAGDADTRLDEVQAALDAEAAAQEAQDREENADNVSGL